MIPALPDVLSGRISVAGISRPLTELFDGKVKVAQDAIREVRLDERRVIGNEGVYEYDGLVLTVGSVPTPPPASLAGLPLHTVHSLESALTLRREVERRLAGAPFHVVIAGGGYTGLEVAAALREGMADRADVPITVVDAAPEILPMLNNRQRARVRSYLADRSIVVRMGTTLRERNGDVLTLSDGSSVEHVLLVWSAGMRAADIIMSGTVNRTADGRIRTTETLNLPGYPEVFVAGDAAALSRKGTPLRRAVNLAYYSGRRAGRNLRAHLRGEDGKPFIPVDLGWVLPLIGTSAGRIFGAIPVGGRFGLRMHYAMCGFRHFGGGYALEFYRTALHLGRQPEPLVPPAPSGSER